MKNIAFLVSGNIRIYEKNLLFLENLKKEFYDYEIIFICSFWQNQKNLDEFNKKYKVKFFNQIKEKDWGNEISKIKYVTGGENLSYKIQNVFYMWQSITENIEFLESVVKKNNLKVEYVCRFRTDIMTLKEIKYLKKDLEKIENNQILFSSNRHFRGITDLFFIGKYETFLKIKKILNYFQKFINDERVFDPEYIFYSFITENDIKIKIAYKLDIALIRIEEAKPTKIVFVPFKDKIKIKIAKRKIKINKLLSRFRYIFD